jgi:hypothetical protein
VTDDSTLGGYFSVHERPPAFEGSDGMAYSVAVYVDAEPQADGTFGAALLFVQWDAAGEAPAGHVETEQLVRADTAAGADAAIRALTLQEVKDHLDRAIARRRELPDW